MKLQKSSRNFKSVLFFFFPNFLFIFSFFLSEILSKFCGYVIELVDRKQSQFILKKLVKLLLNGKYH